MEPAETIDYLNHVIEVAAQVRKAQNRYFQTRAKEDLIAARRLETALDLRLAAWRENAVVKTDSL